MTFEILLTLVIIAGAVLLFASEKLRADIVALLVLLTVVLSGLLPAEQAFGGFSSPAVITVWAVFMVSGALFKTGVADFLGNSIIKIAGKNEPRLIATVMIACGTMSAFMNNIGAVAVLLPAVTGISRQAKIPLSKLLIPLSFASLLGGNMTLIGTPPNILADSILRERGLVGFGFFDFAPTGILIFAAGILYMVTIGRHLLPGKTSTSDLVENYHLREYVSEIRINAGSPLIGQKILGSALEEKYDMRMLGFVDGKKIKRNIDEESEFWENDLILVEGGIDNLIKARDAFGFEIEPEREAAIKRLHVEGNLLLEATLAPNSRLSGKTLAQARLYGRYKLATLAIRRHGQIIYKRIRDVRLLFGDTLLMRGSLEKFRQLATSGNFVVLEPVEIKDKKRHNKAVLSVLILMLVLALVTLGKFPIAIAMVIGAVAMILSGCITIDEAYDSVEWKSIFLIAGMMPLGMAMEHTGTANYIANLVVQVLGDFGPMAVLAGIYLLASFITEPMSNAAATVLMVPISINIALNLGVSPQAFVMTTVIASSTSFLTPVGHQVNVLVFGPGGYRFFDYTKVGFLLNILIMGIALVAVPFFWPL